MQILKENFTVSSLKMMILLVRT